MPALLQRPLLALCLVLAACAAPPAGTPSGDARALGRIQHIVVIYAENRSFDNLYGLFPGANGIASAIPATWTQNDRNGAPLPALPPVWKADATPDNTYPANLPNRPFRIDAPPVDRP